MMETMQTTNTNIPVTGIGARLRAAREALQMSEKDAAARLHLSVKYINLMEAEAFDSDTPVTFLRGYLRSYGRILSISDEEMADALNQLGMQTPAPKTFTPRMNTPVSNNNEKYVRWISYLIGIVLLVLIGMWWSSHGKDTDNSKNLNTTTDGVAPVSKQDSMDALAPPASTNSNGNDSSINQAPMIEPGNATNSLEPASHTNQTSKIRSNAMDNDNSIQKQTTLKTQDEDPNNDSVVITEPNKTPPEASSDSTENTSVLSNESNSELTEDGANSQSVTQAGKSHATHMNMAVPEPGLETSDF